MALNFSRVADKVNVFVANNIQLLRKIRKTSTDRLQFVKRLQNGVQDYLG